MSKVAYNNTFKQQNKKLIRATFKKGFIAAVNISANTVDVSFAENPLTTTRGIKIASNLPIANIQIGQLCRVDLFDEANPSDMVLCYTY